MPWIKTGATHCHAQLGLPDKGRAIKELIVCWVLLNLIPWVFGQERRNLSLLSYPRLLAMCHGPRPYESIDRQSLILIKI